MLFILFAINTVDNLSTSTTGDTFLLLEPNVNGMNNEFTPASSFVSFTCDATIFDTDSLLFSFNVKVNASAKEVVWKELSLPLGDVAVVFLNLAATVVSGNSNIDNEVLSVSYL